MGTASDKTEIVLGRLVSEGFGSGYLGDMCAEHVAKVSSYESCPKSPTKDDLMTIAGFFRWGLKNRLPLGVFARFLVERAV